MLFPTRATTKRRCSTRSTKAEAAVCWWRRTATPYSFEHALIRQSLLSALTSARRARLHRRIGEAIEARPDAADHVDALAFHFGEAVGGADIGKAVDYAVQAGAASA